LTSSTAVAKNDEAALALAEADEAAAIVAAAQAEEYDDDMLSVPILKLAQALTREVQDGNAEAGEFVNTLTNDSLGDKVQFIVSYYNKGRFASDEDSNAYVAFGPDIPANWEKLVGADYVDTPFAEYPEAEETFKAQVNAKEREWGHGPTVSTTHNFSGYVLVDGEDGETDYQPVRLSLKRTDVPAARKINTLHRMVLRNKPTWDVVLGLSTTKKEFGKNAAFVINPSDVKIVRKTTAEEKTLGAQLALAVMGGKTKTVGAEEALLDTPAEPDAKGGLGI
jgi:hypothetical protein